MHSFKKLSKPLLASVLVLTVSSAASASGISFSGEVRFGTVNGLTETTQTTNYNDGDSDRITAKTGDHNFAYGLAFKGLMPVTQNMSAGLRLTYDNNYAIENVSHSESDAGVSSSMKQETKIGARLGLQAIGEYRVNTYTNVYGFAGITKAEIEQDLRVTNAGTTLRYTDDKKMSGTTFGVGINSTVSADLYVFGEVSFTDYGTWTTRQSADWFNEVTKMDLTEVQFMAGVGYRF